MTSSNHYQVETAELYRARREWEQFAKRLDSHRPILPEEIPARLEHFRAREKKYWVATILACTTFVCLCLFLVYLAIQAAPAVELGQDSEPFTARAFFAIVSFFCALGWGSLIGTRDAREEEARRRAHPQWLDREQANKIINMAEMWPELRPFVMRWMDLANQLSTRELALLYHGVSLLEQLARARGQYTSSAEVSEELRAGIARLQVSDLSESRI